MKSEYKVNEFVNYSSLCSHRNLEIIFNIIIVDLQTSLPKIKQLSVTKEIQ